MTRRKSYLNALICAGQVNLSGYSGDEMRMREKADLIMGSTCCNERRTQTNSTLSPVIVTAHRLRLKSGSFIASHRSKLGKVKKVAVKVIRYDQVPGSWKRYKLMDELQIGKHVKHRNIINVEKVIRTPRRTFIFMDLARANLADILGAKYRNGFPENMARKFFSQLISAVNYLHSKGVAHRGTSSYIHLNPFLILLLSLRFKNR